MKSVTSVSGGKTSAYMALHYPTDEYVFAVVLTRHRPSAPKDPGLLRECHRRIPWFEASLEADQTLVNILRLEQELGQEIHWVASEWSLDDFILGETDQPRYRTRNPMLPNKQQRFCTVEQKLKPIAWRYFLQESDPVLMHIGFRWDEPQRVDRWSCENDRVKLPISCSLKTGRCAYQDIEWRMTRFPLYENRINRGSIVAFWERKGWEFPEVSNCRFCFQHTNFQLQYQAKQEPENLKWWLDMESTIGATWGDRPLEDILRQPLLGLFEGEEASCLCTD